MSKTFRSFQFPFVVFCGILCFAHVSHAQDFEATIKIDANSPAYAEVRGRFLKTQPEATSRNLSFLLEYAGIGGLGERISDVQLTDSAGKPVGFRRMIGGEYLAENEVVGWAYRIDLSPRPGKSASAHISWLGADGGLLMLGDLLPLTGGRKAVCQLTIALPVGWRIGSAERGHEQNEFEIHDVANAVFTIGTGLRKKIATPGSSQLKLSVSGEWLFTDEEASAMAASIFAEHERLFGTLPNKQFQIILSKFPAPAAVGTWEADTRGANITILSSDMPFKSQSLQRLHEQLRHEIFHLWVPNGLALSGNYDWFYEGFALYMSLKIGVAANQIRFEDFLDTLSRVYDIDRLTDQKLSLIDAANNRWNGSNTQVYARGMLAAFLCDIALLEKSKGKRSIDNLLRELHSRHGSLNTPQDGNAAVIALLRSPAELIPIVERFITGTEKIDWRMALKAAGLEAQGTDRLTRLRVIAKPSSAQRGLLDKLGYNSWRRLSSNR